MKHNDVLPRLSTTTLAVQSCFEKNIPSGHLVGFNSEPQPAQTKELLLHPHAAAQFNDLPDCAYVRLPTLLALFSCSRATLWRWTKSGRLPAPKKLGLRIAAWNVGQLRACLNNLQTSCQVNSIEGGK